MKRYDDIGEKDHVLVTKWNSESTDDTRQDIQKLGCTIELVILMDKCKEALVHCLTNHFSPWHEFGV